MITCIHKDMFQIYRSHPYSFHSARDPFSMTGGRIAAAVSGLLGNPYGPGATRLAETIN